MAVAVSFYLLLWSWAMKNASPPGPNHEDWKTLYRAAILETNTTGMPKLVSEAEKAVISRKRELFGTMGTMEEKSALDDALSALQAFNAD
jgi:microsomal dipeptidase-like Zn-dependent dipeptidase